ncbi:hypothetical protein HRE53_15210 [Acaryochloris sp. 'Moss Beach']|uniref:DUF6679 family protein n=1 Tax=Acaryochloris TaxID=155977 RepID=UPI001BB0A921|nr:MULTISPECIES: DUF6679 family protein [Acaryochloris]QUY43107.1 hypothetical protein I1H34_02795 [Acaryochloris marina S15]UJB67978.1 hypothetical protein HRE53_15210 [Acaryochloris sp. 'Moss Beach']
MLDRKIYQLYNNGQEVWLYLRDQQRWLDRARITGLDGDIVTIRYETEEDDEICAWEDMVRIESIGAVTTRLAAVPKHNVEPMVSDDCPEAEQLPNPHPDNNSD